MKYLRQYITTIQIVSGTVVLIAFAILIVFEQNRLAFGFLLGGLTSTINFGFLFLFTSKALQRSFKTAFVIACASFFIRMLLIFLVLTNLLKKGIDIFFSAAIGLMLIKVVIISNTIFGRWNKWSFFQR